ncbi:MAG: DNA polymerase I [Patescibacteria group bacterium]|jgi:DNA polymerase-1
MQTPKPTLLLIDGNALIHRAYHAIPLGMKTASGELTNAIYGFTSSLITAIATAKPSYVVACFDVKGDTFRHKQYPQYKAQRKPMEQELVDQIPRIHQIVESMQIPILTQVGVEADDLIGTIAKQHANGTHVYILTGDKDTLQLLDDHISVITLGSGINKSEIITPKELEHKMGLTPAEIIVYKALRGDPSDNIPGVAGIGDVTATKLVTHYHTLDKIYAALDDENQPLLQGKVKQNLIDQKETAYLSEVLATIDTNIKIDFDLDKAKWDGRVTPETEKIFSDLQFHSLMTRLRGLRSGHLDTASESNGERPRLAQIKTESLTAFETAGDSVALVLTYEGDSPRRGQITGVAIATSADQAYILKWDDKSKSILNKILASGVEIISPNIKNVIFLLENAESSLKQPYFDVNLAINLTQDEARIDNVKTLEDAAQIACQCFALRKNLGEKIDESKMTKLWQEVELPLIPVIAKIENNGILVEPHKLNDLSTEFTAQIAKVEKEIWHLAGQEFNIASPSQLSDILFNKLQISAKDVKKNKTAYSTDAETLEVLRSAHPVVDLVLRYRELAKLKNTYLDALPALIDPKDGRIHTTYNQLGAATGRFSSTDPNLQNIPIRSEYGDQIRQAFVAAPKTKLVSADYSQIELRVLAHLSGDQNMISDFNSGLDIHTATAAKIHQIDPKLVTSELRRAAKTINFGILYGLSAHRLSGQLSISHAEAKQFIDRYFASYPGIKQFLEKVIEQSRRDGYYTTLFGRRRIFPEINSGAWAVRAGAERMAMNFPMQGAVADILKMAMIKAGHEFALHQDQIKPVLTIHDELIFEVAEAEVDFVAKNLPQIMTSVCKLDVPLVAEVKVGENWGNMSKFEQ